MLVTLQGYVNEEVGYVIDLKIIKSFIEQKLISKLHNRNLNTDVDLLFGKPLTPELLTDLIFQEVNKLDFGGRAKLAKIQLLIPGYEFAVQV